MIRHNFSFDTIRDSADGKHPEVEILDFQYGDSKHFGTYADKEVKEHIELGKRRYAWSVGIIIPRPEFLYVKWRILATGEVFEDRVDLTTRLPRELEGLYLHFVVRGSQLYVFLVDRRWDGKPWEREPRSNEFQPIPGGIKRYEGSKYIQLYPEPPPLP